MVRHIMGGEQPACRVIFQGVYLRDERHRVRKVLRGPIWLTTKLKIVVICEAKVAPGFRCTRPAWKTASVNHVPAVRSKAEHSVQTGNVRSEKDSRVAVLQMKAIRVEVGRQGNALTLPIMQPADGVDGENP